MGFPGLVLALLASRLRELDRRPPPPIVETLRQWWRHGKHGVTQYVMPLAICAGIGAALAGVLSLFEGIPSQFGTAVFGGRPSVGVAWAGGAVVAPPPPGPRRGRAHPPGGVLRLSGGGRPGGAGP